MTLLDLLMVNSVKTCQTTFGIRDSYIYVFAFPGR